MWKLRVFSHLFRLKNISLEFIWARQFTLITDQKPLLAILGPQNCSFWPRIPRNGSFGKPPSMETQMLYPSFPSKIHQKQCGSYQNWVIPSRSCLKTALVTKDLREATKLDPVLQEVCNKLRNGWRMSEDKIPSSLAALLEDNRNINR